MTAASADISSRRMASEPGARRADVGRVSWAGDMRTSCGRRGGVAGGRGAMIYRITIYDNRTDACREVGHMDYTRLAEFRASLRRFLRRSEEIAQGLGLTPQQHQAMLAIKGFPGRERPTVGAL